MEVNEICISYNYILIKGFKTHSDWYDFILHELENNRDKIYNEMIKTPHLDVLFNQIMVYVREASKRYSDTVERLFIPYNENKDINIFISICLYVFRALNTRIMDLFLVNNISNDHVSFIALKAAVSWQINIDHLYPRSEQSSVLYYICKLPIDLVPTYVDKYYNALSLNKDKLVYERMIYFAIYHNNQELLNMLCCAPNITDQAFSSKVYKRPINFDELLSFYDICNTMLPPLFDYLYANASEPTKKKIVSYYECSIYIEYAINGDNIVLLTHLLNTYFNNYTAKQYLKMIYKCVRLDVHSRIHCLTYLITEYNNRFPQHLRENITVIIDYNLDPITSYYKDDKDDTIFMIIRFAIRNNEWTPLKKILSFLLSDRFISQNDTIDTILYERHDEDENNKNVLFFKAIFYMLYHGLRLNVLLDCLFDINERTIENLLVYLIQYDILSPEEIREVIPPNRIPHLSFMDTNTYLYPTHRLKSLCTPPTTFSITEPNTSIITEHKPYDTYNIEVTPTFEYIKVGTRPISMFKVELLSDHTLKHITPYLRYTPSVAFIWAYCECIIRCGTKELNLSFCKWLHMVNTLDFLHSWHACNPVTINMLNVLLLPSNYDITTDISVLEFIVEKCPHLKVLQFSVGFDNVHTFNYIFSLINKLKYLHTLNVTIICDELNKRNPNAETRYEVNHSDPDSTMTNYGIYNTFVENLTLEYIGTINNLVYSNLFNQFYFIIQSFTKLKTLDCKINHVTSLIHKICLPVYKDRLKTLKYVYCRYTTPSSEKDFIYDRESLFLDPNRNNGIQTALQYLNGLSANTHADLSVILSQYNLIFQLNMQLIYIT